MPKEFICSVCGHIGALVIEENIAPRDNFRCGKCRSMVRQRDVAQLILDYYGRGHVHSLAKLQESQAFGDLNVYEVGMTGPIHARLKNMNNYTCSYFWEDVPRGEHKNGIRCEDLTKLTFPDNHFDLIISLEVFEHVFDVDQALREICRVLKPGGRHIFSVPVRYPLTKKTLVRALMINREIQHIMEPRYHIAGDGSKSLVVSDFGEDFIDEHAIAGLQLTIVYRSSPSYPDSQNASFVAQKI